MHVYRVEDRCKDTEHPNNNQMPTLDAKCEDMQKKKRAREIEEPKRNSIEVCMCLRASQYRGHTSYL